jgi:GNAT superfamily N-acetyltransferase
VRPAGLRHPSAKFAELVNAGGARKSGFLPMCGIICLTEFADPAKAAAEAEAIFWESARTRQFASAAERAQYRDLWFGRYLDHARGEFFLAFGAGGAVTGYLAGSRISDAPPLPGPDYYALIPPGLVARHPAHLHVNIRADRRGTGVGAALMRGFAEHCLANGAPGLHAVTAAGSRAAAFFAKCGLAPRAEIAWRGRALVFLATRLRA